MFYAAGRLVLVVVLLLLHLLFVAGNPFLVSCNLFLQLFNGIFVMLNLFLVVVFYGFFQRCQLLLLLRPKKDKVVQ